MSKELIIGKRSFRYYYYRYKDSPYYFLTVIFTTILICINLVIYVILPQFNDWFSIKNEEVATQEKIQTLNNNINIINNLDGTELENQLQTALTALPVERDFGAIINVISDAALRSGVSLEDYSFQVGNIASPSAQSGIDLPKGISLVSLRVTVTGLIEPVQSFIRDIAQKLPVSEITKVDYSSGSAIISLQFYQEVLPKIVFNEEEPIQVVSDSNINLVKKISSWQVSPEIRNMASPVGSAGAIPLF